MPQSVNDRRKEQVQSADFHLFTAIDRLYPLWSALYQQHPNISYDVSRIMLEIETIRWRVKQFYRLLWGGNPAWMLQSTEVSERILEQRREWAYEREKCQVSGKD